MTKNFFNPALENPAVHSQRLFGKNANSKLAQEIKRKDPALYDSLRRDAVKLKLLEPTSKEEAAALKKQWADLENPVLTSAQIESVAIFPIEAYQAVTGEQATKMKREDPAKYRLFRIAGATHGFLGKEILDRLNVADSGDDGTLYEIPEAIREKLNLEPSLRLTRAGLERAGAAYAEQCVREREAQSKEQAA
jgi:hypothetical protein